MIPDNARISNHALQRFIERHIDGANCKNPEKTFRKLIRHGREIKYTRKRQFLRLISNGCKDVEYYMVDGYVVVYSPENNTVVTFEPNTGRKRGVDFEYVDRRF